MHTKKETNCVLFIRSFMGLCSRSVLITFTVRVTKQHPVNISVLKN